MRHVRRYSTIFVWDSPTLPIAQEACGIVLRGMPKVSGMGTPLVLRPSHDNQPEQEQRIPEAIVLPELSGRPHEDPKFFVNTCAHEFKAGEACDQLKDAALTWWSRCGEFVMTWNQFTAHLNSKFTMEDVLTTLCIEFYTQKQRKQEEAEEIEPYKVTFDAHGVEPIQTLSDLRPGAHAPRIEV
ncbi:hypothetical protein PR048_007171 [Dryococelus australis]|uniref:Retrotransposon gag domain-containing protein n=1 Tax=Dryococelus australis TaxID=614101 RepID=A0ABQ9IDW3_9NEOP|nr:hypothetical protein PR048_007171 [Dryococelus australis]